MAKGWLTVAKSQLPPYSVTGPMYYSLSFTKKINLKRMDLLPMVFSITG